MANVFAVAVYVTVVLIASAYVVTRGRRRGYSEMPPGWSGWPLIGETLSFFKPSPSTAVGNFIELRTSRFGKVFSSNILGDPAVVSIDPELNRFVLLNEMKLFVSYWPRHFRRLFGDTHMGMETGDAHKQFRSIVVGTYVSAARLQTSFLPDSDKAAERLVASWKDGSVISTIAAAERFLFDVNVKNVLGIEPGEAATEKLRGELKMLLDGCFAVPVNLPGTRYNKALKAKENIIPIILQVLEERTRINEGAERNDLIGSLIKNSSLSHGQICELILSMFLASDDSSSRAISLAVYFLESCPEAIEQLREEHLQVVGSNHEGVARKLTWHGYKKMEFTQCVISETLRLGNIAKFLMKKAATDVKFKDYKIPRGSKVIPYISATHFDPSLFEDPHVFNPWRWMTGTGIGKTNNLMAFGGGPRQCPGAELARLQIAVFLHHLVLNYNWKLAERHKPLSTPTIHFPKGLHINIRALSSRAPK